ncbi:hypothetical protein [Leucobacter sp. wl10]|uniref:hypothetical protein n=1 Tax=Leucobacter sp. wl10 TaxID=2304677 RepID=UPI0013C2D0C1|nr:hypothetical protein [Leucobacter sp. wl10]
MDDETRSVFEYDGGQHFFSRRQRRRDPRKHQTARDAGWRIMVLYSEDVLDAEAPAGRRMLEFGGRRAHRIRPAPSRLLEERSGDDTESAVPPAVPDGPPRTAPGPVRRRPRGPGA